MLRPGKNNLQISRCVQLHALIRETIGIVCAEGRLTVVSGHNSCLKFNEYNNTITYHYH